MPIVRIDIESGKTTAYKRELLHGVRDAIVAALGVTHDRVMQRIVETPREDIDATEVRSDRLTIVEISMLPRSAELKETLYREIASRVLLEPGISEHDLIVLVNDPAAECFFINGRIQCATPGPAEEPTFAPEQGFADVPPDGSADEPGDEPSEQASDDTPAGPAEEFEL